MTEIDTTQLFKLAADLGSLDSRGTVEAVTTAMTVTAHRVKDAWNGRLYRDGHARRTGRAISYDVGAAHSFSLFALDEGGANDAAAIIAEIGAKSGGGRQAGVVRLLENGSAHNAPHGYGTAALHENEADFEHGLSLALTAVERAAGL
jgi:hypothetical protein